MKSEQLIHIWLGIFVSISLQLVGAAAVARPMSRDLQENSGLGMEPSTGSSCFDGCQDNPDFVSPSGASCALLERFDCTALSAIGYAEEEVYEVINECPCSCNIECGLWTITPSAAPSSRPTASPSTLPSASPTPMPTTSAPTLSPTQFPTLSPTSSPTAYPTGSAAPSYSLNAGVGSSNAGTIGGVLGAFVGFVTIAAFAFCASRKGGFYAKDEEMDEEKPVGSFDTENTDEPASKSSKDVRTSSSKESKNVRKSKGKGGPPTGTLTNVSTMESHDSKSVSIASIRRKPTEDSNQSSVLDMESIAIPVEVEDRIEFVAIPTIGTKGSGLTAHSDRKDGIEIVPRYSRGYNAQVVAELTSMSEIRIDRNETMSILEDLSKEEKSGSYGDDEEDVGDLEAPQTLHRQHSRLSARSGRSRRNRNRNMRPYDLRQTTSATSRTSTVRPPLYIDTLVGRVGHSTMLTTDSKSEASIDIPLPKDGSI